MAIVYVRSEIAQYEWFNKGVLTTTQAALGTDKSAATAHALTATGIVRLVLDDGTISFEIRFRGVTDADSNVVNLYAMRGDNDHYTRIATLTLTTGTQTDGTYLFIDTIVVTNEKWADAIEVVSDAANGIARISLNTHGYRNFLFAASTLANSKLYIDIAKE